MTAPHPAHDRGGGPGPAVELRHLRGERRRTARYGATLLGKNSDRPAREAQPLRYLPGRRGGGRLRLAYVEIDDVPETIPHLGSSPYWCWGHEIGVNAHGVAIGNEALFTRDVAATAAADRAGERGRARHLGHGAAAAGPRTRPHRRRGHRGDDRPGRTPRPVRRRHREATTGLPRPTTTPTWSPTPPSRGSWRPPAAAGSPSRCASPYWAAVERAHPA